MIVLLSVAVSIVPGSLKVRGYLQKEHRLVLILLVSELWSLHGAFQNCHVV